MERALRLAAPARRARLELPEVLFRSLWAALAIPLLVPLVILLGR